MNRSLHALTVALAALLAGMASFPQPLRAEDGPKAAEPDKLVAIRDSWKAATTRDTAPLKEKYRQTLVRLQEELTKRQRFDHAVLVRDEIEALARNEVSKAEGQGVPPKLKALRSTFARELEKLIAANNEKYAKALQKLQRTYSQEGNLESALAVRNELFGLHRQMKAAKLRKRINLPEDAVAWKGHHYKFFSSPKISFSKAKADCERLGGHLAYLETEEERAFLHSLHNGGGAWVGGSDQMEEGTFSWLDGSPFSSVVKNYLGNDNTPGRDYLYLQKSGAVSSRSNSGNEENFPLKWVNGYLCEWDF